ncbi:MAG: hypothetical protein ABIX28_07025 [Vicinamibacterales bacterium]
MEKIKAEYENVGKLPGSDLTVFTQLDAKGIYQVYTLRPGAAPVCLSCEVRPGGPKVERNKPMISFHPSGNWIVVGIEEDKHENAWMPKSWQRGLLQSGIWLNIWITTPNGDRWYQVTDYKKSKKDPSDGFVGVVFTPDGKKGVWAEIIDGNVFAHTFGVWRLFMADFTVSSDGTPALVNKRDVTPAGAKWVEPGNFAPDGRHMLISADIGMKDARGQDQFSLDIVTGEVRNLTKSPKVWDEHGVYSPTGRKITFMSSYPFREKKDSFGVLGLKTEFMMMDADGGRLQQLTHFNTPGYPEYQAGGAVAAVTGFVDDGEHLFATVMSSGFGKTNWTITFAGQCDR